MIYAFEGFELDPGALELRKGGEAVDLEPQVFALLAFLVANRERSLSKDEIIERVWDGRVVTDASVASGVKAARQALGDDGKTQRFIKTTHGHGYRFVANVHAAPVRTANSDIALVESARPDPALGELVQRLDKMSRPSLAVLPFRYAGEERYAALANALPDELITDLARLRWLLVTARGSSFRFRAPAADFADVGRLLGVRYCLTGSIEVFADRLVVLVDLVDTSDGVVIWADRFSGRIDDVHAIRDDIRSKVLMALEIQIPLHAASLARGASVENLDAWSAYHLGLQHLYRFNRHDNGAAMDLFQRAVKLDPTFARANAGMSFVHFQSAFMHYTADSNATIGQSRAFAERALELDPLDPFVNFTMGRTFWLEGDLDASLMWLERATDISPHYAQGIYARSWAEALLGKAEEGRAHADLAMRLSPLDPLHYAMLATRGFTHLVAGEDALAAQWAERGARSPGAHVLIGMIAAVAHSLAGDAERAHYWTENVKQRNDALTRAVFFRSFPMKTAPLKARVDRALVKLGFA